MNSNLDYKELANKDKEEVLKLYKTTENGLSKEEVNKRLEEYGENIATNRILLQMID